MPTEGRPESDRQQTPGEYRVGRWRVVPSAGVLESDDASIRLEPRVMDLLDHLADRAGEVVGRDELLREVWSDTHVAPIALSRCISQLRTALGDTQTPRRYIETLPKRGYRLVAPVNRLAPPSPADRAVGGEPHPQSSGRGQLLWVAALITALILGAAIVISDDGNPEPEIATTTVGLGRADELVERADEYYARQRFQDNENAIALYEQAVEFDPDHGSARAGLASAYAKRARYSSYDSHWISQAEAEARRAVALDRLNPRTHKALGLALSTRGALTEATAAYRKAVSLDPDYTDAVTNLSVMHWRTGALDLALRQAARAVRLSPTATNVGNVADMLAALGLRPIAEKWWQYALELEPNRVDTIVDLAYADLYSGRPGAAHRRIAELRRVTDRCPACTVVQGDIEWLSGNAEEAAPFIEAQYAADPSGRLAKLRLAAIIAPTEPQRAAALLQEVEDEVRAYIDGGADWWTGPWAMGVIAAVRRDREQTLYWFERAIDAGRLNWEYDERDPRYAFLHGDPDFERLLQRQRERVGELRQAVVEQGVLDALHPHVAGNE